MKSLLCILGRHRPYRPAVKWDGLSYVGQCERCGAPIRRCAHRKWRLDTDVPESGHPAD